MSAPSTTATDRRPLDPYESALLTELTAVVAERSTSVPTATGSRRPALSRRWMAAAGAVAAGAAAMLVVPGGSPAFAVSTGADGQVTIRIDRFEDAAGLEAALAERGVKADVHWLPVGQQCAPGRYTPAASDGAGSSSARSDLGISAGTVATTLTVPKTLPGQTLVLSTTSPAAAAASNGMVIDVGLAQGAVAPCTPIDAALTVRDPGQGGVPVVESTAKGTVP